MCFFDNWGNFYNWNNWSNAQVTPSANPDNQVTDGSTFDPTLDVAAGISGTATGQFYSVTFTVTTPEAGDSFFLDLTNTGFTQVGDKIFYGSIELATVSGGEDGDPFVITPTATVSYGHYYRAGLIGDLVDAVRFSNGGGAESGAETITITSSTSSGTTVVNVPMTYVAGVSAPAVGFDLTGGLSASDPAQVLDHTGLNATRSSITALADGGYVLVWQSSGGATSYDIYGQRYDAAGQAVGGLFTVNSYVTSDQQLPQVSALAEGGFVVVWRSNGQDGVSYGVYGQRYGSDGLPDGAEFRANTTTDQSEGNQTVVGLADGGFVVLWQTYHSASSYITRGQWYDADGIAQGGEITLVATGQSEVIQQATALADGGMAMLSQVYTGGQYELRLYIFDGAGAAVGSPTVVHTGNLGDGARDITALEGGGFAVSWFWNGQINVQRFDDSGAAVGDPIALAGTNSLNSLSITDLAGGGFVVSWQAYLDNAWQIFAQAFGADGQADGGVVSVNPGLPTDTYPGRQSIAQLADGTIVVTWTFNGDIYTRELDFSEPAVQTTEDGLAIAIELTGWDADGSETLTVTLSGMPAGATFNQGEAGLDDTWVIEVTDPDALLDLQMTGPAHYTGAFSLSVTVTSVESGDGSTSTSTHEVDIVVGINASTPVIQIDREGGVFSNPGQIEAFAATGAVASAALPDGGFLSVSFVPPGTSVVAVQQFDAAGEPVGAAVHIDSSSLNKYLPSVAVAEDGSYLVTWHADDASGYGIHGVWVSAEGVAGSTFPVNTTTNSTQSAAKVVALADGGFLVVWQDASSGVYSIRGQKFDAAGQPDGGEYAIGADFVSNTYENYTALQVSAAVLEDGRILVVWSEYRAGDNAYGIRGQILDSDGAPQGPEFVLQEGGGVNHEFSWVTAVDGGGWVLSWQEAGNRVGAQLYDAGGEPVGDEFSVVNGLQNYVPVTALPDGGYVVTWYANDDQLYAQRFDSEGGTVGGVLHVGGGGTGYSAPAIVLDGDTLAFVYFYGTAGGGQVKTFDFSSNGLAGHEDGAIAVPIGLTWPDQDGSETLTVTLSGFPAGATFSQGEAGPGDTWVIEVSDPADLANLTMTAPVGFAGAFLLDVSATTVESADGSSTTVDQAVEITVEAGASDIAFGAAPPAFTGDEDAPIATPLTLTWPDQDGSETMTVTLSGFPEGATFSQGEAGDGGTWTIEVTDPAELLNLTMTAPADWSGSFDLAVTATTEESANGDTASDNLTVTVEVAAIDDSPEITAPDSISVTEDTTTAVTGVTVADVDSASLTVTLTVASGALAATSGGGVTVGGDASALTLTGAATDINAFIAAAGVMFTPIANSEADVTLGVSVTDGALTTEQDVTLDLQPVNDAPTLSAAASGEVLENNASVFTGVTVGDIDSAGLTLTLTASTGTLAAADGSGVTVSGSGTGVLELSGSSADLNAFIAAGAVSFLTAADSEADVAITATVSDGELEASADTILTVLADSIDGGEGDDPIDGTDDGDHIRGLGGDDVLNGGAGDDVIEGGEGDDTLTGGSGADTFVFRQGDGVDYIADPQPGDTIVIYGYTAYTLVTVGRELRIVLDADNYIVISQRAGLPGYGVPQIVLAPDVQAGGAGDDVLNGTAVLDELRGLAGDDVLSGLAANDVLDGGDGDDRLAGGAGDDALVGGAGFDTADYSAAAAGVSVDLRRTTAQDTGGAGVDTLSSIEGVIGSAFADNLVGDSGDNLLRGGAGADRLNGGGGDDTLEGGDGDDVLDGGAGVDVTDGGLGNDLHYVDSAADTVIEAFGQGTADRVLASTSYALSLGAEIEIVTTQNSAGTTAIDLTGNAFGQLMVGNAGANILDGGAGADTLRGLDGADVLIGGSGDDTLTGGAGADQFWFNAAGFDADTVTDFQNGVDLLRVSGIAGVDDFADLVVTANGAGWAVIAFPDGSTVTLTGVLAADVDATDFVFGG